MDQTHETILSFRIEELRCAIPIHAIKTIIRSVAVTPVSGTNNVIQGMIDYRGKVLPVINLRPRFNLPENAIDIHQQFILVKYNTSRFAIIADSVDELIDSASLKLSTVELPGKSGIQLDAEKFGIEIMHFHTDNKGILIIYDIDKLVGTEGIVEIESFFRQQKV